MEFYSIARQPEPLQQSPARVGHPAAAPSRLSKVLLVLAMLALSATASFAQVTVTATAGVTGPTPYVTLGQAFQAINAGTHQGSITIDIATSTNEGGVPANLNSSGAGPAVYTSVLIRPKGDDVAIIGAPPTGIGVIQLNGADNVTIDGDNPDTIGINRNLRIVNAAVDTTTFSSVIRIALNQSNVTSSDNVVFKNLIIQGNARGRNIAAANSLAGSENTTYGILAGGGAGSSTNTQPPDPITSLTMVVGTGATAANLQIQNNVINSAARAIAVQGSAPSVFPGLVISGNSIGTAAPGSPDQVYSMGVTVQGSTNAIVRANTVFVESFLPTGIRGLDCGSISPNINGALFDSNQVLRVTNNNPGTFGAYGINLGGGNNHGIRNNFISDISHNMTGGSAFSTTFGVFGILVPIGTGHQVYNNSVNLHGLMPGTASSSLLSAAFALVSTSSTNCDVRNNIFANNITGGTTSVAHVSVYLPSGGTAAMNLTDNWNSYYCGTDSARQGVGQAGSTAGTNFFVTLAALATYSSTLSPAGTNDNASIASTGAVPFASADDPHITSAAPEFDSGVTIASVTTDIDGETRPQGSAYDIGADEAPGLLPSFSIDNVTNNEGNAGTTTAFVFTVTKTGAAPANTSVDFMTQDGTATLANNDYQFATGTLTFLPADTTKQITVIVNGDNAVEPNETFTVHLSNAFNATIGTADGTGTIINDDAPTPTPTATPTATATATPTGTPCPSTTIAGTGVGAIADSPGSPTYGPPLVISFAVAGQSAPLTNVAVDLTLTHTWVGDLDMILTSPGGTASLITVSRIGQTTAGGVGDSSNYGGLYNFTDSAAGTNIWTVALT
ncbi:MAG TPA: Calx-beta domain-containing protein, partial [Chthoniobacterales bacterium]|nr:Calx-beta domain-containing protein [Chthoniobacterales bacterium]